MRQQATDTVTLLPVPNAAGCHCCCRRGVSNQVQLSTYADAIGDNLSDLTAFLQQDELQGTAAAASRVIYQSEYRCQLQSLAAASYQHAAASHTTWLQRYLRLGADFECRCQPSRVHYEQCCGALLANVQSGVASMHTPQRMPTPRVQYQCLFACG